MAFHGTLTDVPGGFRNGGALHGFTLTSADGDLSGDIALALAARNSLAAVLKSNRIDLDALQAAVDQMPAAAAPPAPNRRLQPNRRLHPIIAASQPPSPPNRRCRNAASICFPTSRCHSSLLRTADADLKLDIADLHTGGADYKAIDTHAVLKGGKLSVDPFAANLPEGHLSGSLTADAAQSAPPVHITLHAPGLALKSILAAVQSAILCQRQP